MVTTGLSVTVSDCVYGRHCVSVTLRVCVSFVWVFVCVCLRRTVLRFVFAEAECQMFFSRNERIFLEKGVFKKEKISSRRSVRQSEGLSPRSRRAPLGLPLRPRNGFCFREKIRKTF